MTTKKQGARRVAPRNGNCPESLAWRALAERVAAIEGPASTALCAQLCLMQDAGAIPHDLRMAMRAKVRVCVRDRYEHDRGDEDLAYYPPGVPSDQDMTSADMREARVLFCLYMALEAAEEYEGNGELPSDSEAP